MYLYVLTDNPTGVRWHNLIPCMEFLFSVGKHTTLRVRSSGKASSKNSQSAREDQAEADKN